MKLDLDKEDSEFLVPLFKWGFMISSVGSFAIAIILFSYKIKEIVPYSVGFLFASLLSLIVSLFYSNKHQEILDRKGKDKNANFNS